MFDPFFGAVENLGLSIWLRESPSLWGFPFVLILHTVGLAFLVGSSVAVNVRVLGLARGVPFGPLSRYFTVMWCGFWVNAVLGRAAALAYPTKALTNPLFYVKLGFIAVGGRRWSAGSAALHRRCRCPASGRRGGCGAWLGLPVVLGDQHRRRPVPGLHPYAPDGGSDGMGEVTPCSR